MKARRAGILYGVLGVLSTGLFATLIWMLWEFVPRASVRYGLLGVCCGIFLVAGLWIILQRRQIGYFADDVCETIDAAIAGRQPENFHPYEDSLTSKVQGKLMQYYDIIRCISRPISGMTRYCCFKNSLSSLGKLWYSQSFTNTFPPLK